MKNLKIMTTAAALAMAIAVPASAQSVYERTDGNGNDTKLGTVERAPAYETVAPVAGPAAQKSGNINRRGPARTSGAYDDYSTGAWSGDRTMGQGNRSKLGQY
jgi:hypothetical protein